MLILEATPEDHYALSQITKKSKAYWGYTNDQILAWDQELTIQPEYIQKHAVYKLIVKDKAIGYYSFEHKNEHIAHLENLFILPEYIGKNFGRILLEDCLKKVNKKGYQKLTVESDPNAEAFYQRFGFVVTGNTASSIEGRYLPFMEIILPHKQRL